MRERSEDSATLRTEESIQAYRPESRDVKNERSEDEDEEKKKLGKMR